MALGVLGVEAVFAEEFAIVVFGDVFKVGQLGRDLAVPVLLCVCRPWGGCGPKYSHIP